jgi:hypothetical protein
VHIGKCTYNVVLNKLYIGQNILSLTQEKVISDRILKITILYVLIREIFNYNVLNKLYTGQNLLSHMKKL